MRKFFIYLVLFLKFVYTSTGQVPDTSTVTSLPSEEFKVAFQKHQNALLIDVREFFEYRKTRIPGAVNIPSSGNLELVTDTLNPDRALFFYCTSGFRSKRVADKFVQKGFNNVYNLEGGITGWGNAGLDVNKKRIRKRDIQ